MTEILIEGSGITVCFGSRLVLDEVRVKVRRGEIVTLIGPNGAGKSTLVRVLLGLTRIEKGKISRRPGLVIGYMPQNLRVEESQPLTVGRFLRLGGRVPSAELERLLDEVGAKSVFKVPLHAVSGGELRRVMLARALIRNPDLLVLDEPVQGVDVNGQSELYRLIRKIRDQRGCGILMVSHDLHLVMAETDHVICLNHHVCCEGHPEAVSRDPVYTDLFGEAAGRSFAFYQHHHDHHHG